MTEDYPLTKIIKDLLPTKESVLTTLKNVNAVVSLWNPGVGMILQIITNNLENTYNTESIEKLHDRLKMMFETIDSIKEKQKKGESNYEASLLCPDLFRQVLLCDDLERAKEHLQLIECLFSEGKIQFDEFQEALRIMFSLNADEYKILKKIPNEYSDWNKIFKDNELSEIKKNNSDNFKIAIMSLQNSNLVEVQSVLYMGGINSISVNFEDKEEKIRLSSHGKRFLETLKLNSDL